MDIKDIESEENKLEIGLRFRWLTDNKFKSAADLARQIGTSEQTLQNYFNGRTIPSGSVLAVIYHLGYNIIWLLTGRGEPVLSNGDINTSNSSGVKYATGVGKNTQIYHLNEDKTPYISNELEILKTENERLKSELKKAERIIELLEKK